MDNSRGRPSIPEHEKKRNVSLKLHPDWIDFLSNKEGTKTALIEEALLHYFSPTQDRKSFEKEIMPTNDVFYNILKFLRIDNNKKLVMQLFKNKNMHVSQSDINSWKIKSNPNRKNINLRRKYKVMPRNALESFIMALHDAKILIHVKDE